MKVEFILAGVLFLAGVVSAVRSLREPVVDEEGKASVLLALHETSRHLFWFSLAGFFLAYGLVEATSVAWLGIVPVAMAAVRLVTAAFLARSADTETTRKD